MSEKPTREDLEKQIRLLEQSLSESNTTLNRFKKTEQIYKTIFNNANDAILIHDPIDGRILDVNQKMLDMYGYTYEEVLQLDLLTISEGVSPYSQEEATTLVEKAASGQPQIFEWKAKHKSGNIFWVEVNLKVVFLAEKDRILAIVRDITDRKNSENALEESETRYKTFINSTPDFVYLKDENFKHIVANTALCEFFGKEPEKVIGLSDFELMPEEAAKVCRETDKKALETGSVFITEEPVGYRIFESIKFPVNLGNSKTGVGCYIRDITERKDASDSLENERSFLNAVLDNIEEAIIICNGEGQLIRFNKSARRLHGIPEKPITPGEWSKFYNLYQVDGKTSLAVHEIPLYNALQGEKVRGKEIIVAPKNSKPRLMVCNGQALYDSGGKKIGAVIAMHDLTDQKRAENDLRQSEEKYRQLVQYAPAALYEIDFINNRFITVNDVACKYTGYKKRELLEMIPTDILTRKSAQHFAERLQKIFSGEKVSPAVEYQIKKKDGGTLWAELNVQTTYEGKSIKGATVVAHDITDRKRAEEAVRKSEKKYRLIAENMADIITTMDMDLNFTYVSPSVIKLRGFSVEEALEQRIDQIMTPESFQRLSDAFAEEISLEQTGTADPDRARIIELEEYKKDGTTIWVENTASFIRGNDQKPSGILVASRDITDRKQAEKALRDSESRFRRLAEMLPEAVFETDKDLNLTYANQQAFNIFGYSQQDFDDGLNCFDMLASEERNRAFENIARRFKGEEFGASEYLGIRKDGSTFPVLLHTNPIYRKRVVDGIRGIVVDLSESKRMEAQVRQAHKMESLGTLAGGIAHEFNNMLGIIIGNTELAIDDIPEWNPAANCIQEIKTASLRAKDVVRKLLSVARKTPESRKPLQIGSVINESLDLMRRTIPATIDIRKNITCPTEMILGDITEINQIVINLCTNSVHAMAEESGVLLVRLDSKQLDRESAFHYEDLKPGNYVKLTVQDTGEGIDPAFMDRLFDPYFTTKDVDQGLGMGLAVVHGIVKNHDGAIKIQSELGKGTIVEVLFPLIEAQAEARTEEIETPQMGTERILLVDDEPSIVTMVTQMLKRSGYEVIGKTSSSNALKTFKEDPKQFDLVISDMAMPEMSGDRLVQAIKQIRPEVPIILCTGHSDRMDENKAKKLGIEAFITKPFSRKNITETIPKVLYKNKTENQG